MSSECFLRVIRVEGFRWTGPSRREEPMLYIQVQLGNTIKKTREIKYSTDSWDELLILPQVDASEDLSIKFFHRERFSFQSDVCLGSSVIHISELSSDWADATVTLTQTLDDSDEGNLSLIVRLLNPSNLSLDIKNDVDAALHAMLKIQHAAKPLDIVEQGVSALDSEEDLCRSFWDILAKLSVFVNFMDDLANINPYLNAAWQVTSAVYKATIHQRDTDRKLANLVHAMKDAYGFVTDTEGLPNKARRLQQTISELLHLTAKCCRFVFDYVKRDFIGRMLHMSRPTIDKFTECFDELKRELDSNIGLHTAFASARIYEKIEDISKKVDIMHLKQVLMPSPMDAFSRNTCLLGTRSEVLIEIADWIRSGTKQNMLWLRGVAGSGKSTIASTVVERCREASLLGAFLFFNRDTSTQDIRASIFRTIAFQLAQFNPIIGRHIANAIGHNANITGAVAEVQFKQLLSIPLNASKDELQDPVVIVIEALDEYGSPDDRRGLVSLLKHSFAQLPPNFRFVLTSRPEADIMVALSNREDSVYELVLDSGSEDNVRDVHRFIDQAMGRVFEDAELERPSDWDAKMQQLAYASEGLFIWASTAIKLVQDSPTPSKKLCDTVENSSLLKGLDRLYASVLRSSGVIFEDDVSSISRFQQVVGLVLVSKGPLTDIAIDEILKLSSDNPSRLILSRLRSVLVFTPGEPIRLLHASFADYLMSKPSFNRGSNGTYLHPADGPSDPWFIDIEPLKPLIAKRCFEIMREMLHFNMCSLETSFQLNKDVPGLEERVKDNIPSHLEYVCSHWAEHLRNVPYRLESPDSHALMKELKYFAYNHLLYWLEVLSLLGKTEKYNNTASYALMHGTAWSEVHDADLSSFMEDADKLASKFADPISDSTPHIYVSMIPLMKEELKVAAHYFQRMGSTVKVEQIGMKQAPLPVKVFEGHTGPALSVAVSPDGERVALDSLSGTIEIWDIQSGRIIVCLNLPERRRSHLKSSANSIAFSQDGQRMVSGSNDKTIRIWDTQSGKQIIGPLEGHSEDVTSVAVSPSGRLAVSGSEDKTIRVWDTESGRTTRIIEGHSEPVRSVVFTPDGSRIVSCSDDGTIRVWDTEKGEAVGKPFVGHTSDVRSIAVSPDGTRVVSGSWDNTVRVWDIESGKIISGPFHHPNSGMSVAFSPDSKRIVSGSNKYFGRYTVVVWDVESGEVVCGPFTDHIVGLIYGSFTRVAFTPDGKRTISGCGDGTVHIWDASIGKVDLGPYVCHTGGILCVAYSPDSKRLVSGSWYGTLGLWDIATCKLAGAPLAGHKDAVNSVAFSCDGHRIVSGSSDKTIIIWDVASAKIDVGPLTGHTDQVFCVDFSPDGTCVMSVSKDKTIIIWNVASGEKISQFGGVHENEIDAVRFSPNGKLIASASVNNDVILWSAETGEVLSGLFEAEKLEIRIGAPLAFSPDGKRIASRNGSKSIIVRDVESGNIFCGPLSWSDNDSSIRSVAFSPNGQYIVSGTAGGDIIIWNTSNCATPPRSYKSHDEMVTCVAFSPDGSHVVSCSRDNIIRVWDVMDQDSFARSASDADTALSESIVGADETTCGAGIAGDNEQCFANWTLHRQDDWPRRWQGWVLGPKGERLLWIPDDMRNTLWQPRNTAILNCEVSMKLDFMGAAIGKRWQECYDPTIELAYPEPEAVITSPEIETTSTDPAGSASQAQLIDDSIPTSTNIRKVQVSAFLHRLVDLFFLLVFSSAAFFHYLLSFVRQ